MVSITDSVTIRRPVTTVFDFVADQRNEPVYNPDMVRCVKTTPGPVGAGSRFESVLGSGRRQTTMRSEVLTYDRPHAVTTRTSWAGAQVTGTLRFEPVSETVTRMTWDWELTPQRWMRALGPLLGPVSRRFERRIWSGLRSHLEKVGTQVPEHDDPVTGLTG